MEFKIGDVVKLNSGGPQMTVSKIVVKDQVNNTRADIVECVWFGDHKEPSSSLFNKASLTPTK